MFIRILSSLAAAVPSSWKYRLSKWKPTYLRLMQIGSPLFDVYTAAGKFTWYIDNNTSQRFLLGTYEPPMQSALQRFVRPGSIVYDVGAHAGFHTCFSALLASPGGHVFAFEPHPDHQASIRRQLTVNPSLPINLLPYAVLDQCGTVHFEGRSDSSMSRVIRHGTLCVQARSLDSLVDDGDLPPPHVIKVDVEGSEPEVLKGAVRMLRRHRPVVLCDYNDDTTFPSILSLLEPLGYTVSPGPPVTAIPAGLVPSLEENSDGLK